MSLKRLPFVTLAGYSTPSSSALLLSSAKVRFVTEFITVACWCAGSVILCSMIVAFSSSHVHARCTDVEIAGGLRHAISGGAREGVGRRTKSHFRER